MLAKYLIQDEVILWEGKNRYSTWLDRIKSYIIFWTIALMVLAVPLAVILFSSLPTPSSKFWTMLFFTVAYLCMMGLMGMFSEIKDLCMPQALTITITNKRILTETANDTNGPSYIFSDRIMAVRTHIAYSDRKKNIGTLYVYIINHTADTPLDKFVQPSRAKCIVFRNLHDPRHLADLLLSTRAESPVEEETLRMIPNQDSDAFRALLKVIIYSGSFLILFFSSILFAEFSITTIFLALCITISIMLLDMREDLNNIHYLAHSQFVACKSYAAKETILPYGPTQWVMSKEICNIHSIGRTIELDIEESYDMNGRKIRPKSSLYMHGIRDTDATYKKLLKLWNRTHTSREK